MVFSLVVIPMITVSAMGSFNETSNGCIECCQFFLVNPNYTQLSLYWSWADNYCSNDQVMGMLVPLLWYFEWLSYWPMTGYDCNMNQNEGCGIDQELIMAVLCKRFMIAQGPGMTVVSQWCGKEQAMKARIVQIAELVVTLISQMIICCLIDPTLESS
jgi:hypothetical protein